MVVTCPSCKKRYRLEEKHFAGRERFLFDCPSCSQPIEAVREVGPEALSESSTQKIKRLESTWTEANVPDAELLGLPQGKRASIAVLQGNGAGQIFPVEKPVIVIGRVDADLTLNDSEVSRHHAQIEFKGQSILLRDLKSTNGTYVNEQRITVTSIDNQSEFRVGATTLMLILTDEFE